MIKDTRRLALHAFLWFSLVYFLLGCAKSAVYVHATNEYSVYALDLLARFATTLLFLFGCVLYLIRRQEMKPHTALLGVLPSVLARAFYILPYDYFYYLYDGYDSIDALLVGLIQTAIEFTVLSLLTLLLGELAHRMLKGESVYDSFGAFDFSRKAALALFAPAFAAFCYYILTELYSAIFYLVTYAGTYRVEEVIWMILSFLLPLGFLFLWQWLSVLSLRALKKSKFCKTDEVIE